MAVAHACLGKAFLSERAVVCQAVPVVWLRRATRGRRDKLPRGAPALEMPSPAPRATHGATHGHGGLCAACLVGVLVHDLRLVVGAPARRAWGLGSGGR